MNSEDAIKAYIGVVSRGVDLESRAPFNRALVKNLREDYAEVNPFLDAWPPARKVGGRIVRHYRMLGYGHRLPIELYNAPVT